MSADAKAICVLIDNSDTAWDGDFYPNRLGAQEIATKQMFLYQHSINPNSQIAIFTCGSKDCGVRTSFTSSQEKITGIFSYIRVGGYLKLVSSINKAILSFHFAEDVTQRRILCFVGAPNDVTEEKAKSILGKCQNDGIDISFVIIGENVPNKKILENLSKRTSRNALYAELSNKKNSVISDTVLDSDFGPGKENSRVGIDQISKFNPGFANELKKVAPHPQASPMKEKDCDKKGKQKKKKTATERATKTGDCDK